ncbi:MAG: N-acetyltransferase [Marinilabiliales bacterium]|nr:MAG: N-acetyltransferase [Marinilabiliales bacterium]
MEFELRPWRKSDAKTLQKNANSRAVAANLTDQFPHPYLLQHAKAFIKNVSGYNPPRILAIVIEGEAVGSIGITPQGDVHRMNAEIGYWLAEPFWGKGITTEAVKRMSAYAFEKFEVNRLFAKCFGYNKPSHRVLEKAGFLVEARFKDVLIKNNEIHDEIIYALRKEDFFRDLKKTS